MRSAVLIILAAAALAAAAVAQAGYRSVRTCARVVGNGIFLLRRKSRWSVVAFGSAFGCTSPLRPAVMRDFVSTCRKR